METYQIQQYRQISLMIRNIQDYSRHNSIKRNSKAPLFLTRDPKNCHFFSHCKSMGTVSCLGNRTE